MSTSTRSYAAFAKSGESGYIAASPTAQQAVTIVLADSGATQCTVAAYNVHAAFIDPETMDPLFQFDFEQKIAAFYESIL